MSHDFQQQRRDTENVFAELSGRVTVPEDITLDLQFVPAHAEARVGDFIKEAQDAGYEVSIYQDQATIELSVGMTEPSAARIWEVEKRATELALDYGVQPDGWGFDAQSGESGLLSRLAGLFASR